MKKIIIFLIIPIVFSCSTKKDQYNRELVNLIFLDSKAKDFEISQWSFNKDTIIIMNKYNQALLKFNDSFEMLEKINKQGLGPEEFSNIKAISIEGEKVLMFDKDQNVFKTFDLSFTNLNFYNKPSFVLDNVGLFSSDLAIATYADEGMKNGITVYKTGKELEQNILKKINTSFFEKSGSYFTHQGFFSNASNGVILYCLYAEKYFLKIDSKGNLLSKGDYVYSDFIPKPSAVVSDQMSFMSEGMEHVIDCYVNDNKLFVLSNLSSDKLNRYVDIYDIVNMDYLLSMSVPQVGEEELPSKILVKGDILYVNYENSFVRYKMAL